MSTFVHSVLTTIDSHSLNGLAVSQLAASRLPELTTANSAFSVAYQARPYLLKPRPLSVSYISVWNQVCVCVMVTPSGQQ